MQKALLLVRGDEDVVVINVPRVSPELMAADSG
jgi:hypothetical protein